MSCVTMTVYDADILSCDTSNPYLVRLYPIISIVKTRSSLESMECNTWLIEIFLPFFQQHITISFVRNLAIHCFGTLLVLIAFH